METSEGGADLLSSVEVVERLLSHPVLRPLALSWNLPPVPCGREIRYRRADLEAWIVREVEGLEKQARSKSSLVE
jgi:hypothetical protein